MKLFCVGCGPGDPDLVTLRAIELIKNTDIIFTPTAREGKPSIALSVVQKIYNQIYRDRYFNLPNAKRF